jgi:hypothetical protein
MRNDDDDTPPVTASDGAGEDAACLVGATECADNPSDGLNQTCLVGTPDCVDADLGGGSGVSAMCAPGYEDCVDTVVEPYGDFGELPERCAADAAACVEPAGCPSEGCSAGEECGVPADPGVQIDPAFGGVDGATGYAPRVDGCLGVDPCTISSEQKCPPDDCAVSSNGETICYAIDPACEAPDNASEPATCQGSVPPSAGSGSGGSPGEGSPRYEGPAR